MSKSSWLIGSVRLTSNVTIVCNGSDLVVPAGTYYLRSPTGALSLIDVIEALLAALIPGSTVRISKDRKIRIISGAGALTLTIPAGLQVPLGLPASPAVGTTVVASNVSSLLWSPGWRGRPLESPLAIGGRAVYDVQQTMSPDGLESRTTQHHEMYVQGWAWVFVAQGRTWTTMAGVPGEYRRFYRDVLMPGLRFLYYDPIEEDDASTTAVTWVAPLTNVDDAPAPYVLRRGGRGDADEWYKRSVDTLDTWADFALEAVITGEVA